MGYLYHNLRDKENFSIQRRTLAQLCRESEAFYARIQERVAAREQRRREAREAREEYLAKRRRTNWNPHPTISPYEEGHQYARTWYKIVELTTEEQLERGGSVMRHCVGSYANSCLRGPTSIWSLRQFKKNKWYSEVTIEVRSKSICQARAAMNALPMDEHREVIESWALREKLNWDIYDEW